MPIIDMHQDMEGDRTSRALARIEAAASRIEAATAEIARAHPELANRYEALHAEASGALADLDRLIEALDT